MGLLMTDSFNMGIKDGGRLLSGEWFVGLWLLAFGFWPLVFGFWFLVFGFWFLQAAEK